MAEYGPYKNITEAEAKALRDYYGDASTPDWYKRRQARNKLLSRSRPVDPMTGYGKVSDNERFRQPRHALDQLEYEDQQLAAQKKANRLAADEFLNMPDLPPKPRTDASNMMLAQKPQFRHPAGRDAGSRRAPFPPTRPDQNLAHLDTVKMQREQQAVEQMMANWNDPSMMASPNLQLHQAGQRMARSGPEHVAMGFSPDYFGASNPLHEMDPEIVKKVQAKQDHHGPSLALSETIVNNIAPKIEDPSVWSAYTKEGWKSTAMSPEQLYGMGLASSFIPTHDQPRIFEGGGSLGGMAKGAATGYSMGLGPYGALAGAGIGLLGGFDTTSPPLRREITWSRGGSIPMPSTPSSYYYQSLLG